MSDSPFDSPEYEFLSRVPPRPEEMQQQQELWTERHQQQQQQRQEQRQQQILQQQKQHKKKLLEKEYEREQKQLRQKMSFKQQRDLAAQSFLSSVGKAPPHLEIISLLHDISGKTYYDLRIEMQTLNFFARAVKQDPNLQKTIIDSVLNSLQNPNMPNLKQYINSTVLPANPAKNEKNYVGTNSLIISQYKDSNSPKENNKLIESFFDLQKGKNSIFSDWEASSSANAHTLHPGRHPFEHVIRNARNYSSKNNMPYFSLFENIAKIRAFMVAMMSNTYIYGVNVAQSLYNFQKGQLVSSYKQLYYPYAMNKINTYFTVDRTNSPLKTNVDHLVTKDIVDDWFQNKSSLSGYDALTEAINQLVKNQSQYKSLLTLAESSTLNNIQKIAQFHAEAYLKRITTILERYYRLTGTTYTEPSNDLFASARPRPVQQSTQAPKKKSSGCWSYFSRCFGAGEE